MTVITGYEPASIGNTLYVPEEVDTSGVGYDHKFIGHGQAFKMWAGLSQPNTTLVANGNPVVQHLFRLTVSYGTPTEVNRMCQLAGSDPRSIACTTIDNPCHVHVSPEHSDQVWGHELWHCVAGYYHG